MSAVIITEAAQAYLAELPEKQNTLGIGVRIFITQSGTQYAETYIAYHKSGEEKVEDAAIALKDFVTWIDVVSEPFLEDAVVDYTINHMGGQLTIKTPSAEVPMINEDSSVIERINYYLQVEISPGLVNHGGQASLVGVVEDNATVLCSGDGCQGCGIVGMTLKDGVERTLIEHIPELKDTHNVIDHNNKENTHH